MTDRDQLLEMFKGVRDSGPGAVSSVRVVDRPDIRELTVHGGYSSFVSIFEFDATGKLVKFGAYE